MHLASFYPGLRAFARLIRAYPPLGLCVCVFGFMLRLL